MPFLPNIKKTATPDSSYELLLAGAHSLRCPSHSLAALRTYLLAAAKETKVARPTTVTTSRGAGGVTIFDSETKPLLVNYITLMWVKGKSTY